MKTIFKYPLKTVSQQQVNLPVDAIILTVQTQKEQPCIWAMVDTNKPVSRPVTIEIFGTGHEMDNTERRYIGTYQLDNGEYVFHVFKRLEK